MREVQCSDHMGKRSQQWRLKCKKNVEDDMEAGFGVCRASWAYMAIFG